MKLFVHTPETPEGWAQLTDRVAAVHAEAVLNYIQNLSISHIDQLALLHSVCSSEKAADFPNP